jgi:RNA polymerase sigma-70 factor (ECF subfamily)
MTRDRNKLGSITIQLTGAIRIDGQGKALEWLARFLRRLLEAFSVAPDASGPGSEPVSSANAAEDAGGPGTELPEVGDLYRKYAGSLYWVCMKYVRNKEDAEDMVNQAFVKVQKNLAGFKGESMIYSWMYRIAVNECIQLFRKRKFESDGSVENDFEELLHTSPEGGMDARLLVERIAREADPETMEIVFLLYLEGLTQGEVVEKLGISRTTVHRKVTAFKAKVEKFR